MIAQMMAQYRPKHLACNNVNKSREGYNPLLNRNGILLIIISLWMANMNIFEVAYSKWLWSLQLNLAVLYAGRSRPSLGSDQ
jgi:uncharacterized integral membrane protein